MSRFLRFCFWVVDQRFLTCFVVSCAIVKMSDWSAKKDTVVQQLRFLDVNELTQFCTSATITIPDAKQGNRDAINTLVMRFINSETVEDSADQGLKLFTDMEGELSKLLALRDDGAQGHDADEKKEVATTEFTMDGHGNERNLMNSYNVIPSRM